LIVTKHAKEKVIAPILEKELGVQCFVAHNFDTDSLGTFSGEIERKEGPLITAKKKCLMAMKLNHCDLAVASEGSFGPHPTIHFIPADNEIVYLIDSKNSFEMFSSEISTETNFDAKEIRTQEQLNDFARQVNFPTHGLILRKSKDDYSEIKKGVSDWETLNTVFSHLVSSYGTAYVETDMRAMFNPTRMVAIKNATQKLVEKINTCCPECDFPGFGITGAKQGLLCSQCNCPTHSILSYTYSCMKCAYNKEVFFPNHKTNEDPMYCDICNP